MSAHASSSPSPRSVAWVAAQFALMLAQLFAGPWWRGQCTGIAASAIGGALVLTGAWLGLAGVRVLGLNRTPFPEPKPGSQLVTTGIYARVRHPLYASVIALGFGWTLLWRSGPALTLAAAQIVFFYAKARIEERLLRERFAEYADYSRRVPRLFPRLFSKPHVEALEYSRTTDPARLLEQLSLAQGVARYAHELASAG